MQRFLHRNILLLLILSAAQGCSTTSPQALKGLDSSISQAIYVHPVKEGSIKARLSAWQRQGKDWHRLFLVSAVIGRNGLAHPGQKKEGDGRTPSGIYPLGPAFGYAPSINTGLPYRQATDKDFWVDDTRSMQYNLWVNGTPDARSFERLRRPDNLYQYGIVIGYNENPVVPGAGSAIFMHVWRRYGSPTSGCVALNQRYLRKVLSWLQRQYQPVIILE
jgi:L,D-peptidoglycan transpeptidase YkuD (ErfK/YbiS/YcfS/YnhG family)